VRGAERAVRSVRISSACYLAAVWLFKSLGSVCVCVGWLVNCHHPKELPSWD
jgi:hypothetical protein